MEFSIVTEPAVPGLARVACTPTPAALPELPGSGALTVRLVLRRHRVSVVTVSETDPGLAWMTPCVERELTSMEWPWRRGRHEVSLTVTATDDE